MPEYPCLLTLLLPRARSANDTAYRERAQSVATAKILQEVE